MDNMTNSDQPEDRRSLHAVVSRHCEHIRKPYTLEEICEQVSGEEYNSENRNNLIYNRLRNMNPQKATLAILAITATLQAGTISIGYGPYGIIGGYDIHSSDGWAQDIASSYAPSARTPLGFLSFCLEKRESFTFGTQYQYGLSATAVRGGTVTADPISVGTGFLYSLFTKGTLPGFNADQASTAALQNTIWFLEGEQVYVPGPYDGLLSANFVTLSAAAGDSYNGLTAADYGVRVINVGTPPLYPGQDMLVYQVPESGGIEVTATVAAMMLGIILFRERVGK